jgi:hypothetical protein
MNLGEGRMSALAEQHEKWADARSRLFNSPPPIAAKAHRPHPVSPFVREARERRRAQREAFERQMLDRPEPPYVDLGWPPYTPVAPYDDCAGTPTRKAPITMREIVREVARKHGVSVNDIVSERRPRAVVLARHEAMWRCKQETTCSLPQIGRAIGGRDHTTVLHGVRMHQERMSEGANA